MKSNFNQFQNTDELLDALCKKIKEHLQSAISQKVFATLIVSGGKTPIALFKKLSTLKIEWQKVTITLADERWVKTQNEDSNQKLVKDHLLQNEASLAKFIGLKTSHKNAYDAIDVVNKNISDIPKPFDLTILGMGEDAHTASLFPDAKELDEALFSTNPTSAITPPKGKYERITLSLKTILDTKLIILHIEGENKYRVYKEVIQNKKDKKRPISFILKQQKTPVEVYYA